MRSTGTDFTGLPSSVTVSLPALAVAEVIKATARTGANRRFMEPSCGCTQPSFSNRRATGREGAQRRENALPGRQPATGASVAWEATGPDLHVGEGIAGVEGLRL